MPLLTLHLAVDRDAAGRTAYETFVARNADPKPWDDLSEMVRETWRAVALSVLPHVREDVR